MELIRRVDVMERQLSALANTGEDPSPEEHTRATTGWGPAHSVQAEEVAQQLSIRNLKCTYKRGVMKPLFMLGEFDDEARDTFDEDKFEEKSNFDDPLAVAKHDYASEDRSIREYCHTLNRRRRRKKAKACPLPVNVTTKAGSSKVTKKAAPTVGKQRHKAVKQTKR